jgi:hypothetical protein
MDARVSFELYHSFSLSIPQIQRRVVYVHQLPRRGISRVVQRVYHLNK